ncbi:serpin B8-like [Symsagittifera roscoffensis]|uniref:serpin B8-like n=1 Tax=Symsagittifera roscoffensis TaxID=84072 RepID=UPI00307C5F9C
MMISPASVFVAMCMVSEGAQNTTKSEILRALQFEDSNDVCKEAKRLVTFIQGESQSKFELSLSNGVFLNKRIRILKKFQNKLMRKYSATVENVGFGTEAGEKIVNDWISDETNGKITDLIKDTDEQLTVMIIVNAIYMNGSWKECFAKSRSERGLFFSRLAGEKNVTFMNRRVDTKLAFAQARNQKKFTAAFLKYQADDWMMSIILPADRGNPADYLEPVSDEIFQIYHRSSEVYTDLWIPKFKVETSIDIMPLLKDLGIKQAFDPSANFFGASKEPTFISKARQKSYLEVSEEGTEAAAATYSTEIRMSSMKIESLRTRVIVDSPFLVSIINTKTKLILFAGVVWDPSV